MIKNARLTFNDKWVSAMFNPGWGEPGEWYLNFSDGSSLRIDNTENMGNQERYLATLTADKYRDEIIKDDWRTTGSHGDVMRIMLNYVGYNDARRLEDLHTLEEMKRMIVEGFAYTVETIGTPEYSSYELYLKNQRFQTTFKEALEIIDFTHECLSVYDHLQAGTPVGLNWSNESFLRDSPYAARVQELSQLPKV